MANVKVGDKITAATMNGKVENTAFTAFAAALDDKFAHIIYVGTEAQWNALSAAEKAKYQMRGVPL